MSRACRVHHIPRTIPMVTITDKKTKNDRAVELLSTVVVLYPALTFFFFFFYILLPSTWTWFEATEEVTFKKSGVGAVTINNYGTKSVKT